MANYRYFRVRITKVRAGTGLQSAQFSDWNFLSGGSRDAPTAVVAFHPGDSSVAASIDDASTANKYYVGDQRCVQIMWDFGAAVALDEYRWYTADDADTRDPVSWVVEASDDPDAWWWTTVHTVTDYATTTSRNTLVNTWAISPPSPDTPPTPVGQAGRYWRFTPTARRGGGTSTVQYSEFQMLAEGLHRTPTAQSSPSGQSANATDWTLSTKLEDGTLSNTQLVVDLGASLECDEYRWFTAGDADDRDPISWTLERSDDNTNWTTVDTRTSETITTARGALAFSGTIADDGPPPATTRCHWGIDGGGSGEGGSPPPIEGSPDLAEMKRLGTARPFAEDGPWNTIIPVDAVYYDSPMLRTVTPDEQTALGQSNNRRHWYIAATSVSINYTDDTDPLYDVDVPAHNYNPFGRNWPAANFDFHGAEGLAEDQDSDHILIVQNTDDGELLDMWQARTSNSPSDPTGIPYTIRNRTGSTGYARSNVVTDPGAGSELDPPTGIGNSDGTRASNFSWLAGILTARDVAADTIDHALVVGLGYLTLSNDTWWWPATGPDNGGHSGFTDMGDRIAIPRDVEMPADMSPLGQKFFVCLQEYGAYVGDFVGSAYPHIYINAADTYDDQTLWDLYVWFFGDPDPDIDKMLPHLRIVGRDPGG